MTFLKYIIKILFLIVIFIYFEAFNNVIKLVSSVGQLASFWSIVHAVLSDALKSSRSDSNDLDFELFQDKEVQIKPGRGTLLHFFITPLKIGVLPMKITAKSSVGQDILIKYLNVEAEGE